jgi:hypothetical protein
MVYTRRRPTLPLPETDPSSESVQTTSLKIDLPSETVLESGTRRSTRVSCPPDRYGFPHTSFNTTLSYISTLYGFSRLLNMNVGRKRWMRNFGLSRTIIHGTWFLAPLMLKPLVVNRFTRLSSTLMGLWIGIRHD